MTNFSGRESLFFLAPVSRDITSLLKGIGEARTYYHSVNRANSHVCFSLFPRRDVNLSFLGMNSTPMQSGDHVGRTSCVLFFFFFFSNVAGTDVYVKYRCEEVGTKICWSSTGQRDKQSLTPRMARSLEYQLASWPCRGILI